MGVLVFTGAVAAVVRFVEPNAKTIAIPSDLSVFAAPFDALVGIAVERRKIFPELSVSAGDGVAIADGSKLLRESPQGTDVKFVLVGLDGQMLGPVDLRSMDSRQYTP